MVITSAVFLVNVVKARLCAHGARFLDDGSYELTVPFGDKTEIMQQILKYGLDVEVLSSESLRQDVIETLQKALAKYQS